MAENNGRGSPSIIKSRIRDIYPVKGDGANCILNDFATRSKRSSDSYKMSLLDTAPIFSTNHPPKHIIRKLIGCVRNKETTR